MRETQTEQSAFLWAIQMVFRLSPGAKPARLPLKPYQIPLMTCIFLPLQANTAFCRCNWLIKAEKQNCGGMFGEYRYHPESCGAGCRRHLLAINWLESEDWVRLFTIDTGTVSSASIFSPASVAFTSRDFPPLIVLSVSQRTSRYDSLVWINIIVNNKNNWF